MTEQIPISKIFIGKLNARPITGTDVTELAESIEERGLLQPILVRPIGQDKYEVVAGQRRLLACKQLGWKTIEAGVRKLSDEDVLLSSLIENVQREELDPVTRAKAIDRLVNLGHTLEEIAKMTGIASRTISDWHSILKLAKPLQEKVAIRVPRPGADELGYTSAREIVRRFKEPEMQKMAYGAIKGVENKTDVVKILDGVSTYREEILSGKTTPEKIRDEALYRPAGAYLNIYLSSKVTKALDIVCDEREASREDMVSFIVENWLKENGYVK